MAKRRIREYSRPYVGIQNGVRTVFRSVKTPTPHTHSQFTAVVGPFHTMRGAQFLASQGGNNPHCTGVRAAEKLAKAAEDYWKSQP